jgi:hypothetical protein
MIVPRRLLVALVPLLLYAGAAGAAGAACDAPPPTVHPAASDTAPESAKAFGGTWQGQWPVAVRDRVMPICARLYVLVLGAQTATVEQCTGSNRAAGRKSECKQFAAQIDGNAMTFTDLQGTAYAFTMADVGGMKGEAVSAKHRAVTVFTKRE